MSDDHFTQILSRLSDIETKKGTDRAWDIAGKILIPLVLALGAWSVGLEVRLSRIEDRTENMPPQWLKNDIASIQSTLRDIELRIRGLEHRKEPK